MQEHSHKPEEQYAVIERCSPGPYLELFARKPRPGWHVWAARCTAMPSYLPRTWLDRLFGLCFSLLLAAIAAHVAVELIEAVWTALLVILGVGLLWRPGWRCCATGDRGW